MGRTRRSGSTRRKLGQWRGRGRYLFHHQRIRDGDFLTSPCRSSRRVADFPQASRRQDCSTLLAAHHRQGSRRRGSGRRGPENPRRLPVRSGVLSLPVGWTLTYEFMFYLLFAAALAMRVAVLRIIILGLGLIAIAALARTDAWP